MTGLNVQFEAIRQSATVAMGDHILALKASGRKIVGLQVGDPDFATPAAIMDVAMKAMSNGLTHYTSSRGIPDLLAAISQKLQRDEGVSYDPASEILVTHGGIHAYYTAMQSILNPGDEVLVPDPSWATHANMALMLRGNVVRVPAPSGNGFIPHFESWEKALTPKTRVIVLNYPSNPTGAYPTRKYLQRLHDFAKAHDLWIVSDEVYGNLYYGEKPTSAAAFEGAKERTLLINSLSKTYAMTGWRVGFLAAPRSVIDNALKAGQNSITCVSPFIQKAAAFALTDPGVQKAAADMRAAYARRRDRVLRIAHELESEKVHVMPPQGAFYFFLDFRPLKRTSVEICERVLEEAGVGLVPGSAFGVQGEGFVRMTIAASDDEVEEGFRKIVEWTEKQ
ncbi:MAG TPA: aminotransferase class I/II-fold pyridoxal phosphate-dependent enzyme [Anaerolineales bacterium]|nr:aminotransferase class I/II-fold pyridoxal phosphate-dependent enzyme [Anaerolineales bacterium]